MPSLMKSVAEQGRGRSWGWLALLFVLCELTAPGIAWARRDRVDRRSREQAEQLREEGVTALNAKDLPTAKRALYQSYEKNPLSETLYFLGLLAASEGQAVESQDLLRRFLREVGESVDPAQQKEATRLLAQPLPPFGELDVQGERGALLTVDGRLLGILPLSQPVILPPGLHTVVLGQGARKLEGPVDIRTGRTAQLRFDIRTGVAVVTLPSSVLLLEDYRLAPPATQTAMGQAVEQSVRTAELAILSARAALVRAPELANCLNTRSCQEQLLQKNEVDFAVHLYLATAGEGSAVTLQGQLIDAATGDAVVAMSDPLDLRSPQQPPATAAALCTKLLQEARTRPRGTLEVLSTPPGAEVVLQRGVVGRTPYLRPAFAGTHEVTVQLPGYQSAHLAVKVEGGKKETVQLLLNPLEGEASSGTKRPLWRTVSGAVGIGLGGTIFTFGVIGLLDDRTDGRAIAATVVGPLIAGAGIILLTLPTWRRSGAAKK